MASPQGPSGGGDYRDEPAESMETSRDEDIPF
jgi:hypothetical protein